MGLREQAQKAYTAVVELEEAHQSERQAERRARQRAVHQTYEDLRSRIVDAVTDRFEVAADEVHVRATALCNGVPAGREQHPDALIITIDGIDMIAGNCRALALGNEDFSIHLTESNIDTASGYQYWMALSRDLTDLAALGRALEAQ